MRGGNYHRRSSYRAAAIAVAAFLACSWATGGMKWPLAKTGSQPASETQVVSSGSPSTQASNEAETELRSKWQALESAEAEAQNDLQQAAGELAEAQEQWEAAADHADVAEKTLAATASELAQIDHRLPQIDREIELKSDSFVDLSSQLADVVRAAQEHAAPEYWERAEEAFKAKARMQIYEERMAFFHPKNFPAGVRIDFKFQAIMAARDAIKEVPRRWEAEKAALQAQRDSIDADYVAMKNASERCADEIAQLKSEGDRLAARRQELNGVLALHERAAQESRGGLTMANAALIAARRRQEEAEMAAQSARDSARQALAEFDSLKETQRGQFAHVRNAAL